jgi:hypothetical protein
MLFFFKEDNTRGQGPSQSKAPPKATVKGGTYIGNTQPHNYGENLPPIGYLFTWDSFSLRMDI